MLKELILSYNDITSEGATDLAKGLQVTDLLKKNLGTIRFWCCSKSKESQTWLIWPSFLQMNETLLVLKLNGNKICNKGALVIAGALQVNMVLQELDMADTDMVHKRHETFFNCQNCYWILKTFVLQSTESCVAMATVLNYNNTLKVLNMNRPILHVSQVVLYFSKHFKHLRTVLMIIILLGRVNDGTYCWYAQSMCRLSEGNGFKLMYFVCFT